MKTKTYIISMLEHGLSNNRLAKLTNQLASFSIDHTVIEAVTPTNADIELKRAVASNFAVLNRVGVTIENRYLHTDVTNFGVACCAASHAKALQQAIDDDLDYVVIMEDDASIIDYALFLEQIDKFVELGDDAFLGYFCNTMFFDDPGSFLLNRGYQIKLELLDGLWSKAQSGVMSTVCYIVNVRNWRNRLLFVKHDLSQGSIADLYLALVQQPRGNCFVSNVASVGQSDNESSLGDVSYSNYVNRAFREDSIARYRQIFADPFLLEQHELVLHNHLDKRYLLEVFDRSNERTVYLFESKSMFDIAVSIAKLANNTKVVSYERNYRYSAFLSKTVIHEKSL